MSLKAFHILFVSVSVVLAVGFGFWGIREFRTRADSTALTLGVASFAAAVALLIYGRWFLRKLRKVDSL